MNEQIHQNIVNETINQNANQNFNQQVYQHNQHHFAQTDHQQQNQQYHYQNQGFAQQPYQQQYNYSYAYQPNYNIEEMKKKYKFTMLLVFSVVELVTSGVCGVLGLIFVLLMNDAIEKGDLMRADKYAKYTKISLIVGAVVLAISIILMIVYFAIMIPLLIDIFQEVMYYADTSPYYYY